MCNIVRSCAFLSNVDYLGRGNGALPSAIGKQALQPEVERSALGTQLRGVGISVFQVTRCEQPLGRSAQNAGQHGIHGAAVIVETAVAVAD